MANFILENYQTNPLKKLVIAPWSPQAVLSKHVPATNNHSRLMKVGVKNHILRNRPKLALFGIVCLLKIYLSLAQVDSRGPDSNRPC